MTAIAFRTITAKDLQDPNLGNLNNLLRQMINETNRLGGSMGPIQLNNTLDLQGNPVRNIGAPVTAADALSQTAADPMYSQANVLTALSTTGNKILQTARRLNDPSQRERNSSFLNQIASTPPTTNTSNMTVTVAGGGSTEINLTAGNVSLPDGSVIPYSERTDIVSAPGTYYYYLRSSDLTVQLSGPFSADTAQNLFSTSLDGRIYLGKATVEMGGGGAGGGGGDPGGVGCCEIGTILSLPPDSEIEMELKECIDWAEIELENGQKVCVSDATLVSTFIAAHSLRAGDLVEIEGGGFSRVRNVELVERKSEKMCVRVSPGHVYYGGGIRVHNFKVVTVPT
jgi:hypothetical protein